LRRDFRTRQEKIERRGAEGRAADHFLMGKLTVRPRINASSARTAKNTTPANTAM
jgi:hypothetical protein